MPTAAAPPGDADDVVSETFTVAWRRLDSVPEGDPLPWLYGVARKVLANQRRGRRRWFGLLERIRNEPPPSLPGQDDHPVLDALQRLKPTDREVLLLAAWEGLTHREIGAVMGVSENAIGIRVHRARKRLAGDLAREGAMPGKVRGAPGQSGL